MDSERTAKRLVWIISAAVFLDTVFYAVISPMLPALSHQLGLSKLSAGLLTASYAIGMLVASLPGGVITIKIGPRRTVGLGLTLLAVSTLGFAFANSAPLLDLARIVEGVGGACTWAGGLAWLNDATPVERRGATVGKAMAAGIAGSLLGPAIGAIAAETGRATLFSVLVLVVVVLLVLTLRLPGQTESSGQGLDHVWRAMKRPAMLIAGWLVMLPGIASGIMNVLGPLQLHHLGAGAFVIGALYLAGSAIETLLSPWVGRISDRRGRLTPLRVGMLLLAPAIVGFMLPRELGLTAVVQMVFFVALGMFWAPAMAMLADVADRIGLDQAHAAALMNLTWAAGQILGSAGGGGIAQATGDTLVAVMLAALSLLTLVLVRRSHVRERDLTYSA